MEAITNTENKLSLDKKNEEMKVFSVAYQFEDIYKDNSAFLSQLKSFNSWWQQTPHSWLISTDIHSAMSIRDKLLPYLSSGDKLFIVRVTLNVFGTINTEYSGVGLLDNEYNWIKNNL